jgi:hypothetical protein
VLRRTYVTAITKGDGMLIRVVAGLGAAMLLVSACGSGSASVGSATATPPANARGFPAPDGLRWVGMADVVVAVPDDWETAPEPCAAPDGDVVLFLEARARSVGCGNAATRRGSELSIAPSSTRAIPTRGRRLDIGPRINGLESIHSGVACMESRSGPCTTIFAVPTAKVVFRIAYRGPDPKAFVLRTRNSLTSLPSGFTTVPFIEYGTSVEDAKEELAAAGLTGESPDANFPHYATGTVPTAGSVVGIGDVVEIKIGDG